MKRVISFLLLLCLLLTMLPVAFPVLAEESLPKDESGASATVSEEEAVALNDYDSLYVTRSAGGGELKALYSAFGTDLSTVDLAAGTWADKMGGTAATIRGTGWTAGVNGGFAYDFSYEQRSSVSGSYGISLPESLLTADVYVETAATVNGIRNADGTLQEKEVTYNNSTANHASFVRIDALCSLFFLTIKVANGVGDITAGESLGGRWFFSYWAFPQHFGNTAMYSGRVISAGAADNVYRNGAAANGKAPVFVRAYYGRVTDTAGNETYTFGYHDGETDTCTLSATDKTTLAGYKAQSLDKAPIFSFFNGAPCEVYAIRVYSSALTEAERQHNFCVDLYAYAGVDIAEYSALDSVAKSTVDSFVLASEANTKKDITESYSEAIRLYSGKTDFRNNYYVTEGLTLLLAAYKGFDTGSYTTANGGAWLNALDNTHLATLKGSGWYKDSERGGLTVHRTIEEYDRDTHGNRTNIFGVYLPAAAMPDGDYTLEVVANPVGITKVNENGERERYIDNVTGTGTYNTMAGFCIGPLRCLQFACYRPVQMDGQMERRWYYSHDKNLNELRWVYRFSEHTWQDLSYDQVVTFGISHAYKAGDETAASTYSFYNNGSKFNDMMIGAADYKTNAEAGNTFHVMSGVAGTTFAVRVYDRVLNEAERRQNRAADILYYYDVDTSFLDELVDGGFDKALLLDSLADLDFDMPREEAQRVIGAHIASAWLTYQGVGVRKAGDHSLRFYFTPDRDVVSRLENVGFTVEMGVLANIDKASEPIYGYADHNVVMYDGGAYRDAFFVDDDTFALTVRYSGAEKQAFLTAISVCGYIRLIHADGTETLMYVSAATEDMVPDSLFAVYNGMKDKETVTSDVNVANRIAATVEKCYEKLTVHVKAGAPAGGDGSVSAPYHSFADGFAACKTLMARVALPTRVTLLLADGVYGVYDTQCLASTEMPYRFLTFEITSENGNSTLTTTKNIEEGFTKYTDNIWVCQLEKEDGAYPDFRYLYVDGRIADLSYSGGRYVSDATQYVSKFERDFDGPWSKVKALYDAKTLTWDSACDYTRPDLIAAFEAYKTDFLALAEMEAQYEAGTLAMDSVCTGSADEDYVACYEAHKLNRFAFDDLKAQYTALEAPSDSNFYVLSPTTDYAGYENYAAYKEAFVALRQMIYDNGECSNFFDGSTAHKARYEPHVFTDSIEQAKYYLNLKIVGDLTAEIAEGKARNEAAYEALLAAYNAADEAGKAELEDALALAAEKANDTAGEYTWIRYALEGYGPAMHLAGQWWNNIIHVAGVDYEDTVKDENGDTHVAVYLEKEEYANYHVHKTYTMVGRYVHMKDALSYVDSEGEYYYDDYNGKLYYYSASGLSGHTFERGTNDYMFYFDDVKNVTVSDLRITGVDDAYLSHNDGVNSLGGTGAVGEPITEQVPAFDRSAILLDDCYGITVRNCTFEELGARAIFGRGVLSDIRVESNTFKRLGGNAVQLGNGKLEVNWRVGTCTIENVTVTDNYIYDVAREYYTCSAVWLNQGKDVTITYNTVDTCSYSGICVGYTFGVPSIAPGGNYYHNYNVEIAYNYISGFMHELGDGGAIYVTGGNSKRDDTRYFNYVHHNYIPMTNKTGNGLGHMLVGIYFDGSSSNWLCYENVIAEQSYGAASGENDSLAGAGDPYTVALRKRRAECYFIYLQHISGQKAHNILCEGNYILNVRATSTESQKTEVYRTYVDAERNLAESDTHYVRGVSYIPATAQSIARTAGCFGHKGTTDILKNNDY